MIWRWRGRNDEEEERGWSDEEKREGIMSRRGEENLEWNKNGRWMIWRLMS